MAFQPPSSKPFGQFVSRSKRIKGKMPVVDDEHRLNERIRVPQVRLIDEKGEQVGVVDTREALRMARERGFDLVEIAPGARPPVCKILDYGKFKYEKKKKETAAKKNQIIVKTKEIQLRPNTDTHDQQTKIKKIREFLEDGDRVKIVLLFRGRQMAHTELGFNVMTEVENQLKDIGAIEQHPKLDGKKIIMLVAPLPKKPKA